VSSLFRAIANLRQSWVSSAITTGIIAISLLMVGSYLLLDHNLNGVLKQWKKDVQITIYLRDGFSASDVNALIDRVTGFPEMESVTYVTKEQALKEFKSMLGGEKNLLEGLGEQPLPASLRLTPRSEYRNVEGVRSILSRIGDDPLVEEIAYGKEWLQRLEKVMEVINLIAAILGGIICLAAIFIISNTIKLTVLARKEELEIMRLVGATEGFIRTPFLIEGLMQGLAGSAISIGLLVILYQVLVARIDSTVFQILGIASLRFLPPVAVIAILVGGMALGGVGSLASVGRFSR